MKTPAREEMLAGAVRVRIDEKKARAEGRFDFANQCRQQADALDAGGSLNDAQWVDRGSASPAKCVIEGGKLYVYLPASGTWFWLPLDNAKRLALGVLGLLFQEKEALAEEIVVTALLLLVRDGWTDAQVREWLRGAADCLPPISPRDELERGVER